MATPSERLRKLKGERSITDSERKWIAGWGPKLQKALLAEMAAASYSHQVTAGLLGYLTARSLGHGSDIVSSQTRARYRKILEELGDPPIMFDIAA